MADLLAEKRTLHFYEWEYKYRGYYLFDIPVDIEAPYSAFRHILKSRTSNEDDGRFSFWEIFPKKINPPDEFDSDDIAIEPTFLKVSEIPILEGFKISFPRDTEISIDRNIEFLNILSFTENLFSFEVVATNKTIHFQFVATNSDVFRIKSQLEAYFPSVIIEKTEIDSFGFSDDSEIAIIDFALNDEFMRGISTYKSLGIDSLTSFIATLSNLEVNDIAVFQILCKGIKSPLAKDIPYAVSDGFGGSFFANAPEMVNCAKEKVSQPLFSVVMRVATQSYSKQRTEYLAKNLSQSITTISTSEHNKLIPLSNDGYKYDFHYYNLHKRLSNRLGFILNTRELSTFLHYPNKTISSNKIGLKESKSKKADNQSVSDKLIGFNEFNNDRIPVYLDYETLLSHTHIIGATGVGKSTLLANMMLADIENGVGCAIFDPHGDIIDDILIRIPESRIKDVILIDPSDADFPIGFNLLEAHSDAEKIVLSSDLVSSFKRHATAWGDNMSAVLQNAINTILESTNGGTLIDLKRLLIEDKFRGKYLESVNDPSLHYYWKNEYPMVKKGIAPLLTRIDTFLRPKLTRYMLAQKKGVDISECVNNNKIVLLKLSQGLIGESNSYLLGSLFLAKFNQAALSRQSKDKKDRKPYMLYLDEFHNFITPSIERILSGARKYGLGLTIAHQELSQIEDNKLLNSVLSNPKTRICFRLGDQDAKKLESGFSYFEQNDLQNLNRGEAIVRVGASNNDFNIKTQPLSPKIYDLSDQILSNSRKNYATSKQEIEEYLYKMLSVETVKKENIPDVKKDDTKEQVSEINKKNTKEKFTISEEEREKLIDEENKSSEIRAHNYLQLFIKKLGQDRNFISTIEYPTNDGGRIDIVLEREGLKIGFEISETNKPAYEVQNIKKCLKAGCIPVVMVSKTKHHLNKIQELAIQELSTNDITLVHFIQPDEISLLLDKFDTIPQKQEEIIKGFRIVTEFDSNNNNQTKDIKSRLARLFKGKK